MMLEFTQNSSWGWDIRDSFMQLVRISRSLKHMSGTRGRGGGIPGRKNMGVGVGVLQGVTEKSGGS